jgi:pSer/pThr/pTyr-binding forkhead associated (FHA) protein
MSATASSASVRDTPLQSVTEPCSPSAIQAAPTDVLDALPLLSPRSLRDAIAAEDPAPGRYLVVEGDGRRRLVPLSAGVLHIGRGFAAELRLDDGSVSRKHAVLHVRQTSVRILDDRSANGTYVNGRRVTQADLTDGDVIVLGRVVLSFLEVDKG